MKVNFNTKSKTCNENKDSNVSRKESELVTRIQHTVHACMYKKKHETVFIGYKEL